MAKCKLLMQTGQVQKIIDFFDGYSDDKVSCKYIKKVGIKAEFECETELSPEEAAGHCKGVFKGTPEGKVLYFSIQPDGSLDKIKMIRTDKSLFFSSQKITLCI